MCLTVVMLTVFHSVKKGVALAQRARQATSEGAVADKERYMREAYSCYKEALEYDPKNADAHTALGAL